MDDGPGPQKLDSAAKKGGEQSQAVQKYDFRDARRLSQSLITDLRRAHESFAKHFADSLSGMVRMRVNAKVASFEQVEPLASDQEPPEIFFAILLNTRPLDAPLVLGMDASLASSLLEVLLGGKAAPTDGTERELTEIELFVLQDLHALLIRELERAWRNTSGFTFRVVDHKTDLRKELLSLARGGTIAVSVDIEVAGASGRMTLVYPDQIGKAISPVNVVTRSAEPAGRETESRMFEVLRTSRLALDVCLQGPTLRLRDLVDLQAGDLLRLDAPLESPINISINGKPRCRGSLTDSRQKRLLRVDHLLSVAKPDGPASEGEPTKQSG